jgi:hypothetical protein
VNIVAAGVISSKISAESGRRGVTSMAKISAAESEIIEIISAKLATQATSERQRSGKQKRQIGKWQNKMALMKSGGNEVNERNENQCQAAWHGKMAYRRGRENGMAAKKYQTVVEISMAQRKWKRKWRGNRNMSIRRKSK